MEAFAWPMAAFAALFALTPTGIMFGALGALKQRRPNTVSLCMTATFVSWTFSGLFALLIPYGDIAASTARMIGVLIAMCFAVSFFITGVTIIPFVEEDEPEMSDWAE